MLFDTEVDCAKIIVICMSLYYLVYIVGEKRSVKGVYTYTRIFFYKNTVFFSVPRYS